MYSMLSLLSILAIVAYGAPEAVVKNNVTSNYVIYYFQGATYFPYALDKCNAAALTGAIAYKFTCAEDGESVMWYTYGNRQCTGTPSMTTINTTYFGYDTSLAANRGMLGAFECMGTNNYASVTFNVGTCDGIEESGATIHAALSICVDLPYTTSYAQSSSLNVWCNNTDNAAQMQYFSQAYDMNCASPTTITTNHANDTCGYIFTFTATGSQIYGQVDACMMNEMTTTTMVASSSTTTSTTTQGASSNSHMFILSGISFVLLFIAHLLF